MARLRDMKREDMFGGTRGQKSADSAPKLDLREVQNQIDQIEKDMNELKSQYELYFMGIEKLEPIVARDLLKSELRRWQEAPGRNTAIKFKLQMLKARMVSLENYWQRILKLREAGLYKRDQERVKRRADEVARKEAQVAKNNPAPGAPAATAVGASPQNSGQAVTGAELHAGRSGAETRAVGPGAKPAAAQASADNQRPSATSAEDLTEPKLRKLYQTYVSARKRCGEAVDLRYEDMAAALRKQVPKLMTSTGAKSVEFKVVIRAGRAVLKAVPK